MELHQNKLQTKQNIYFNMRLFIILFSFLLHFHSVKAQYPAGQNQGGQRPDSARFRGSMKDSSFMNNMIPIGKVIGILRDSSTRQPLEFASIALLKVRERKKE